jgi:hypothetical protein
LQLTESSGSSVTLAQFPLLSSNCLWAFLIHFVGFFLHLGFSYLPILEDSCFLWQFIKQEQVELLNIGRDIQENIKIQNVKITLNLLVNHSSKRLKIVEWLLSQSLIQCLFVYLVVS